MTKPKRTPKPDVYVASCLRRRAAAVHSLCTLLLFLSSTPTFAESGDEGLYREGRAIEQHLFTHATNLRDRFGITFYALAAYLDKHGKLRSVSPSESPEFQPEAVASKLRETLTAVPGEMRAVTGILVDYPENHESVLRLESASRKCLEVRRAYSFGSGGEIEFAAPTVQSCTSELYP